jgi:gas vesicle protein
MAKLLNVAVNGKKYMADSVKDLRDVLQAEITKIDATIAKIGGAGEDFIKKLQEAKKQNIKEWDEKIQMAKNAAKIVKQKDEIQKVLDNLK